MAKIVTMGETMLRLSIPDNEKFIQTDESDTNYGGGGANVAVSLADYGHDVQLVTATPKNPVGDCTVAALRKYNAGTKHIARNGERLGTYFLETGSVMRASDVVYDHANSAIATATPDEFNFDETFADVGWFHFTGITPAISDAAIAITEATLKAAKVHGVTVSVDLSLRKRLWFSEKAQKVTTNLMQYVDVCIGNEESAEKVLGFKPGNTDVTSGELELVGYIDIFNQTADKFGSKYIISSLYESHSASNNGWSACIMDGETREFYHFRKYRVTLIVDRVGGGDSFAGDLTCGLADDKNMKAALEFAITASALKHTIPGDFNLVSRADVDNLAGDDGSGRVQR